MNAISSSERLSVFAAGAAHVDRRGRCDTTFRAGTSNPGAMSESVGGAALNAARAMRGFGADVRLVSARGGDRNGATVAAALAEMRIADLAMTWLDRRTPTYTAILDVSGDLVGGIADMALYDLLRPRVFTHRHVREAVQASDLVLLDANLPAETIERLVASAATKPIVAIGVSPAKVGRLALMLPRLTALFVSLAEATELAGLAEAASIEAVVERLARKGCRRVVVTDGPRPAAIVEDGAIRWQPPPLVGSTRDVTGAGDTLAGAAAFAFGTGSTFLEAARFGMVAASLHVSAERRPGDFAIDAIRSAADFLSPAAVRRPANQQD